MKRSSIIALGSVGVAGLAAGAAAVMRGSKSAATVKIDSGALSGAVKNGVLAFKGMPYRRAAGRALRWRPPQPVAPLDRRARSATRFGPTALQVACPRTRRRAAADERGLPDLNVWTPAGRRGEQGCRSWSGSTAAASPAARRPAALYDGATWPRDGVVVVSFNYRLGRLGFFAHPALTAEQPGEPPGNFGLHRPDRRAEVGAGQHRGLRRRSRQRHHLRRIAPAACSISFLMASPLARGLFHKAIVQSRRRAAKPPRP